LALNRIVYAIVVFMTALFIFLFEHRATYAALYAVLLLPAVSLIVLLISKRRINISEKLESSTVKKGETARYIISAENNNYLFSFRTKVVFNKNIRRFIKISKTDRVFLPSRGNSETLFEMLTGYRGIFTVSADYILIYDSLGLFKVRIKNPGDLKLTVLPDIHSLTSLPVSLNNPEDNLNTDGLSGEDYSDLPDFKKYSPSDGYKKIHWQLSAKRGELISKNYHASEKNTAAVIINNSKFPADIRQIEKMRCEDILIEAAVSVIACCISMDLPVYLDYIGEKSEEAALDFESLYLSAAGIEFDGSEDFGEFLTSITEMRGVSNIYIFTREVTDSIIDCVKNLHSYGRNAVIFYYTKEECKIWRLITN